MRLHGRSLIQENQTAFRALNSFNKCVGFFKGCWILCSLSGTRLPLPAHTAQSLSLAAASQPGGPESNDLAGFQGRPPVPPAARASPPHGRGAGRVVTESSLSLPLQVPLFKGLSILTLPPAVTSTWAPRSRSSWRPTSPWPTPCSRSRASAPTWPRPTSTAAPCTSR